MTMKTALTLTAAIGLGIVTTKVGRDLVLAAKNRPAGPEMARVVIADRTMDPGYQLTARDLAVFDMPRSGAPEARFGNPDEIVGRTLVAPVVKGQAMFDDLLAPPGVPAGLEALVPQGMRAVSIEVSESSGMVGLIRPGSRVDVIATVRKGDQSVARTIVENVKVSAVGQKLSRDGKDESTTTTRTVTLVVTPKHAEAIELAGAQGRPRLALRGPQDTGPSSSSGVSEAELRGEGAMVASAKVEAVTPHPAAEPVVKPVTQPAQVAIQRRSVQIIRGGKESMIYYDLAGATTDGAHEVSTPIADGSGADGSK